MTRIRTLLVLMVIACLTVATVAVVRLRASGPEAATHVATARQSDDDNDADADADAGSEAGGDEADNAAKAMSEALEKHPGLAAHRLPLAFVSEKLEQSGGEASGEIVNGPAQELYADQAYPRPYVRPLQRKRAAQAFGRGVRRGARTGGVTQLRLAQGRSVRAAGSARWRPVGPSGGVQVAQATYTGTPAVVSGRATSMAISPRCSPRSCPLFLGTAGGGLWKTDRALAKQVRWRPIGRDIPSQAIGSVYLAPDGSLYVGTGEPNGSSDSEAGVGLFHSTNGGRSFTRIRTVSKGVNFTTNRSIATVVADPRHRGHLLLGTAVARHGSSSVNGGRFTPPGSATIGVYETFNGGRSWRLTLARPGDTVDPTSVNGADYFRGGVTKILFDPTHPHVVYAAVSDYGLFRRSGRRAWRQIYTIHDAGSVDLSQASRIEFALAALPDGHTRVYLGDATYYADSVSGFLRTDDATAASPAWTELSSPDPGTAGYGTYNFCETQCSYDMVVASPPGEPDQVFLSGSMNYDELQAFGGPGSSNGRAVVRSTDAGVHVTDMTNDAAAHPDGLHPDQHALVFAPGTGGSVFFSGSDGGVVRQRGPFVDASSQCAARGLAGVELADCQQYLSAIPTYNASANRGLNTLQFQSVTSDGSGSLQGGTQDNGTWESDTGAGWQETVGGDGGQSGFNVDSSRIRYHSYYLQQHDVSFDGGSPTGWDWISDPLFATGETASFYTPFLADPTVGGTIFDGLQHVWRSTDNGGDRAYLDQHCNELTGDFSGTCGDWVPLGGAAGDLSGGDTANYVVAVERSTSNDHTMWSATRKGDVYLSDNADAADPASVTYTKLDDALGLPNRFVSGIYIDPANPYHVWMTFSGYSAYSPGGHVYDVTWDPATGTGTARDISGNLGDQPVTDITYVPRTQALYVGTSFGVLSRAAGSTSWVAAPGMPKVATYGLTLDEHGHALYAATHGRGIWRLPLG